MGTVPVFNEVIGVSFDTASFAASIRQIQEMWTKALEEMSGKSPIVGLGNLDAVTASVNKIAADIAHMGESYAKSLDTLFGTVTKNAETTAQKGTEAIKKFSAQAVDDMADQFRENEQMFGMWVNTISGYLSTGGNPKSLARSTQADLYNTLVNSNIGLELNAKQRQWMDDLETKKIASEQRKEAAALRAHQAELRSFKTMIEEQIAAGKLQEEAFLKMTEEERAIAQTAWMKGAGRRDQADKMNTAFDKENQGFGASFMEGLTHNLSPQRLGNFAGITIGYGMIGAAIGAAYESMSKLVEVLKSGWEYTEKMQEATAKLQGVLAENVKLSSDEAENFRMAGAAAEGVYKKFQDAAIQYGTKVEVLERAFKQFIDAGGASLTRNVGEAADLAIKLSVSLQAAGKDADATRSIISEIPKLVSGTAKPSSLVLETLQLNKKEWAEIVAQARTHHDLLDQISARMQNYQKVAEEAGNRQKSLTESIHLEITRIVAEAEKPFFASWTEVLKEVKKWLEDNKQQLTDMVTTVGDIVIAFGKVLGSIYDIARSFQLIHPGMGGILSVAKEISWQFSNMAVQLKLVADLTKAMLVPVWHPKDKLQAFEDAYSNYKKNTAELGPSPMTDEGKRAEKIRQWKREAELAKEQEALDAAIGDGSKKPDIHTDPVHYHNEKLELLKKQYETESALIDANFEKEKQNMAKLVAQYQISREDADKNIAEAAEATYSQHLDLITSTAAKAAALSGQGVDPKSIAAYQEELNRRQVEATKQNSQRQYQAELDAIKATQDLKNKTAEDDIAAQKRVTDEHIAAVNKRAQREHGLTVEMALDQRAWLEREKEDVDKAYDAEIAAANKNTDRVKELTAKKAQFDDEMTKKLALNVEDRISAEVREFDRRQDLEMKRKEAQVSSQFYGAGNHLDPSSAQFRIGLANANLQLAKSELEAAKAALAHASAAGAVGKLLDDEKKKVEDAIKKLAEAEDKVKDTDRSVSPEGQSLKDLGGSITDLFKNGGEHFVDKFSEAVTNLGNSIDIFHDSVNNIFKAFKEGGAMGGIGAIASTAGGIMQTIGGSLGPVGQIASAIGGVISSITSIFTQRTREIAEAISEEVSKTMQAYQNQTATMVQTLQALQAEREQAINELSGRKGGQEQLDKLLPQIDQEIASLNNQIKQAKENFNNVLHELELHNSALASAYDKWQAINKAVQDYLSAGGDVAKANKYISDSLEEMKQAAKDGLNQGYATAIQDAQSLLDLTRQRLELEQQEAQAEFNIINGDALERRGSKAIAAGTALQQQKAQFQQQLDNLNAQIDLTQQKVALEGQLYDLAMSTADLQKTANALQIEQLKEQLDVLRAQKDIYDGIIRGSDGSYSMTPTLMNEIGVVNINVTPGGTPGDTSAAAPQAYADAIAGVLQQWSRYGLGTALAKA